MKLYNISKKLKKVETVLKNQEKKIITKKAIVEKACKNGVQSGRTSLKQDLNQINLSMCQVLNVSPEI